jgi:hypothetical protein
VGLRGVTLAIVARQPSPIEIEPSPSSAMTPRSGCAGATPSASGHANPHAVEHIEVLRPVAGGEQIEIAIADAADDRLILARRADRQEIIVGGDAVDQRSQHVIRHVADLVVLKQAEESFGSGRKVSE